MLARPGPGPGPAGAGRPVRPGRGAGREVPAGPRPRSPASSRYALRLPDEFALLALRDALAVNPKLVGPAGRPAVDRQGPAEGPVPGRLILASLFARSTTPIWRTPHGREPSRRRRGRRLLVPGRVDRPRPADRRLRRPRPGGVRPRPAAGRRPACGTPWRTSSAGPASWSGRWPPGTGSPSSARTAGRPPTTTPPTWPPGSPGEPPALTFDPWDGRARPGRRGVPGPARPGPGAPAVGRPGAGGRGPGRHPAAAERGGLLGARPPARRLGRGRRAVERAADGRPCAVYVLRHRLDADAVRAVRDAVVAEVQAEAVRIRDEVAGRRPGRPGPGDAEEAGGRPAGEGAPVRGPADVGLAGLHAAVDGPTRRPPRPPCCSGPTARTACPPRPASADPSAHPPQSTKEVRRVVRRPGRPVRRAGGGRRPAGRRAERRPGPWPPPGSG